MGNADNAASAPFFVGSTPALRALRFGFPPPTDAPPQLVWILANGAGA